MQKISQSKELFLDLYLKMSKKIEESTDTIFSGVSIADLAESNYKEFMESSYIKQYYMEESIYQKNLTIKAFIENEVLSEIYTNTYDRLLHENDDGELSFSQTFILEETEAAFNVKYKGASLHKLEQFEEGLGSSLLALTGGAFATGGVNIPLVAFGALTVAGIQLFLPARYARVADSMSEKVLGDVGKALFGTRNLLAKKGSRLGHSNNNILNFDNINVNPEVKKLFNSLSRTQDKKAPIAGLDSIVTGCLEYNDALSSGEIDEHDKGYFRGKYAPINNNIFKIVLSNIFKKSSDKKDDGFNTLIRYRKCLAEKLVDMYKFLMIANISQSKDYKKIIRIMQKGFHENPEQLLGFMSIDDEHEQLNKENILILVKFRMFLDDMVTDLHKGAFDVDKESSIYLKQKLSVVDTEIEEYLAKNKKTIETAFENREEFNRKDYKYNKPDERKLKRKFLDSGKSDQYDKYDKYDKYNKPYDKRDKYAKDI